MNLEQAQKIVSSIRKDCFSATIDDAFYPPTPTGEATMSLKHTVAVITEVEPQDFELYWQDCGLDLFDMPNQVDRMVNDFVYY